MHNKFKRSELTLLFIALLSAGNVVAYDNYGFYQGGGDLFEDQSPYEERYDEGHFSNNNNVFSLSVLAGTQNLFAPGANEYGSVNTNTSNQFSALVGLDALYQREVYNSLYLGLSLGVTYSPGNMNVAFDSQSYSTDYTTIPLLFSVEYQTSLGVYGYLEAGGAYVMQDIDYNTGTTSGTSQSSAFQPVIGAGIGYKINDLSLGVGYRYIAGEGGSYKGYQDIANGDKAKTWSSQQIFLKINYSI